MQNDCRINFYACPLKRSVSGLPALVILLSFRCVSRTFGTLVLQQVYWAIGKFNLWQMTNEILYSRIRP